MLDIIRNTKKSNKEIMVPYMHIDLNQELILQKYLMNDIIIVPIMILGI